MGHSKFIDVNFFTPERLKYGRHSSWNNAIQLDTFLVQSGLTTFHITLLDSRKTRFKPGKISNRVAPARFKLVAESVSQQFNALIAVIIIYSAVNIVVIYTGFKQFGNNEVGTVVHAWIPEQTGISPAKTCIQASGHLLINQIFAEPAIKIKHQFTAGAAGLHI